MPVATFTALKGGRNIDNNARKRVAEKNVDEMPKILKNILFVLDIEIVFTIIPSVKKAFKWSVTPSEAMKRDLKLKMPTYCFVASLIKLAVRGLEFTLFPRAPCPSLRGFEINFSLEELNV